MQVLFIVMFRQYSAKYNLSKMLQRFVKDNPSSNLLNSPPKIIVQWKTDLQEISSSWLDIHVFGG